VVKRIEPRKNNPMRCDQVTELNKTSDQPKEGMWRGAGEHGLQKGKGLRIRRGGGKNLRDTQGGNWLEKESHPAGPVPRLRNWGKKLGSSA